MTSFTPNAEQVAVSWLLSLSGLYTDLVQGAATFLKGDNPKWDRPVFLVVTALPSKPHQYSPERSPIIQIDCYAAAAMYGEVKTAGEMIRDYTYTQPSASVLTTKSGFKNVRLGDVSVLSDPVLVRLDGATKARCRLDIEMAYVIL